ncbi:MAG TPA: dienelactone hydrolase family protein [Candidatus Limnocylindrales bacterium]|nr:dienelactone hydrolase family protein [Candidatus Limnocylindrales bacterium]
MCFDFDARPPIPPIAGGAIDSGPITLAAADGNRFTAFRARAAEPSGAGMLVLPDVRGLHPYYEDLALRFAENGIDAVAIDYFGRTAGLGRRGPGFDHAPHVAQTTFDGLTADVRAAAGYLRSEEGGAVRALFTIGFCFGGRLSFLCATLGLELAGVIGFYGWPVGPHRSGTPAPADVADRFAAPVLAIFGGADEGIPLAAIETFEAALRRANVEHEIVVYPNAPHSFFDRRADEFARTSEQAWQAVLEFVRAHTRTGAPA